GSRTRWDQKESRAGSSRQHPIGFRTRVRLQPHPQADRPHFLHSRMEAGVGKEIRPTAQPSPAPDRLVCRGLNQATDLGIDHWAKPYPRNPYAEKPPLRFSIPLNTTPLMFTPA